MRYEIEVALATYVALSVQDSQVSDIIISSGSQCFQASLRLEIVGSRIRLSNCSLGTDDLKTF
ncbi:hypothetical protein F383_35433 [Gossypium arboreum]|uniref:Uncharacterized protein n=1 Tax=Gossypium arboreum TaxID=29729 RepID=A0A0B0N7M0_GOSAR|nr:hypothetical protein F383_35433 [Gossypium arboreum]